MAHNPTLDELIQLPFLKGDTVIKSLLQQIIERDDSILFVCNVSHRTFIYMDSTCERKLGHPAAEFITKGSDRMYEITVPERLPAIVERQVYYINQAKQPGFDPRSEIVMEFPGAVFTSAGLILEFVCICVVLTFSEHADLENAVCIMVDANEKSVAECSSILRKIKQQHNIIYTNPPFCTKDHILNLVHITSERFDKKISPREEQVLALLANGLSTDEIASKLSITEHTVETHRKHLLEKLGAKNTAELIKKASKVFWLE